MHTSTRILCNLSHYPAGLFRTGRFQRENIFSPEEKPASLCVRAGPEVLRREARGRRESKWWRCYNAAIIDVGGADVLRHGYRHMMEEVLQRMHARSCETGRIIAH
jgi:hypothetical protein